MPVIGFLSGLSPPDSNTVCDGISPRHSQQCDEIASFQVIEFHSVPCAARAEVQDIELARISQEEAE